MKRIRKWIKYLFPVLAVILLLGLIFSRVYQPEPKLSPVIRINALEASGHIGTVAEVCGRVASADFLPEIGGEPTFINLERPHPDQPFTAVIWGRDRHKWQFSPHQHYAGRRICVTGKIELHEDTPQIVVSSPDQIVIRD